MKYVLNLSGSQKTSLDFVLSQALHLASLKLEELKFTEPHKSDLIYFYDQLLLDLEYIEFGLLEGGEG